MLDDLHVELDRQEATDVERVHGHRTLDEIVGQRAIIAWKNNTSLAIVRLTGRY